MQIQPLHNLLTDNQITPKIYVLFALSFLYMTFKLTCNTLFFRQTNIYLPFVGNELRVVCSAFIYPAIYVLSDAIVALSSRKTAIVIIILGTFCDGIFSWATKIVAGLNLPTMVSDQLANSLAINQIGPQIWRLYYHGVAAALVAAIAEVIIFSVIFRKINSFFLSTVISVVITLFVHNMINDYPMLRSDPNAWNVIFNGLAINITIMVTYAAIVSTIIYLMHLRYNK